MLTYCVLSVHALGVLVEAVAELLALFLSPLHQDVLAEFLDTTAAVLLHLLLGAPSELHTEHAALMLLRNTGRSNNSESPQTTWIQSLFVGGGKKAIDSWITVPI